MPIPAGPVRGVEVTVAEPLGDKHIADEDDRGTGDVGGVHLLGKVGESAPQHLLLRPRRECDYRTWCFGVAAAREQLRDDRVDLRGCEMQDQSAARGRQRRQILTRGIAVDSVATRVRVTVCATRGR